MTFQQSKPGLDLNGGPCSFSNSDGFGSRLDLAGWLRMLFFIMFFATPPRADTIVNLRGHTVRYFPRGYFCSDFVAFRMCENPQRPVISLIPGLLINVVHELQESNSPSTPGDMIMRKTRKMGFRLRDGPAAQSSPSPSATTRKLLAPASAPQNPSQIPFRTHLCDRATWHPCDPAREPKQPL